MVEARLTIPKGERLRRLGLVLLAVPPAIFGVLALIEAAGLEPGLAARLGPAVAGVVSVSAYAALAGAGRRLPAPFVVIAGFAVAVVGHYGVAPFERHAGAALVYLGLALTAMGAATRLRAPLFGAGAAVAAATLARGPVPPAGRVVLGLSAVLFAALLLEAARRGPVPERGRGGR